MLQIIHDERHLVFRYFTYDVLNQVKPRTTMHARTLGWRDGAQVLYRSRIIGLAAQLSVVDTVTVEKMAL